MSYENIFRELVIRKVIELFLILFLFFVFFVTLITALYITLNEISENPTNLNKSFTAWVEDGTPITDLNIYGNKQPDKIPYSVFNGMLKLVISKDELIDENEFNQIADNSILKVYIRHLIQRLKIINFRYRSPYQHRYGEIQIIIFSSPFLENMNSKS